MHKNPSWKVTAEIQARNKEGLIHGEDSCDGEEMNERHLDIRTTEFGDSLDVRVGNEGRVDNGPQVFGLGVAKWVVK